MVNQGHCPENDAGQKPSLVQAKSVCETLAISTKQPQDPKYKSGEPVAPSAEAGTQ